MARARKQKRQDQLSQDAATILAPFIEFGEQGTDTLARYLLHVGIDAEDIKRARGVVSDAVLSGRDLTINWSYKGQSNVLYLSNTSRIFPGLVIILNNGATGDQRYMVTGVYPSLGYVTVLGLHGDNVKLLSGDKNTVYSGSVVKQEPFAFRRVSGLPAIVDRSNSISGAITAAQGDLTGASELVLLTLSGSGASNYTTRTAAEMWGDIPDAYVGLAWMVEIANTSADQKTLVGGTGVTIEGTATIDASTTRRFRVKFTSSSAVTITNRGAFS